MGWEEQGSVFAVCCLAGAFIGIGADGYRAWQMSRHTTRSVMIMLDCLLWCVLAVLVCVLMLRMNGGDMRSYVFLALAVGYLVYRQLVGQRIVRLWLSCARTVRSIFRWAWRVLVVLCLPVRWCLRAMRWLIRRVTPKRKSPPSEKS